MIKKSVSVRPRFAPPQMALVCATLCLLVVGILATHHMPLANVTGAILEPQTTGADGDRHESTPLIIPAKAPQTPLGINCGVMPCLALTFDDGPNPLTTPHILDTLEHEGVHASFFVIGSRAISQPSTIQRMYKDGDEIGNHSWSHPDFTKLNASEMVDQVDRTQAAVMAAGVPAPYLFRPPYGAVNSLVRATVPMTFAMWNIDPVDWQTQDVNKVRDAIVNSARPGAVIDLHDIYGSTAQAIGPAIDILKTRYHLVTFSQMFNLGPGQTGEFFGR